MHQQTTFELPLMYVGAAQRQLEERRLWLRRWNSVCVWGGGVRVRERACNRLSKPRKSYIPNMHYLNFDNERFGKNGLITSVSNLDWRCLVDARHFVITTAHLTKFAKHIFGHFKNTRPSNILQNFSGSNTDGSFTTAVSNSILSP